MTNVLSLTKTSYQKELDNIKAALLGKDGYIRLGFHSKKRIYERGYYVGDIIACLQSGQVTEVEEGYNSRLKLSCENITVEGFDQDDNPIVVVFSKENVSSFSIVTVMPPTDKKRFLRVI